MKKLRFVTLIVSLVFVSVFTFIGVANAQSVKAGENVGVSAGETVDSMMFVAGNNINIAGTVNGDLYCAGQNVNISGTVNGDVFCAGQTININGNVTGSVRLVGQTVNIVGTVSRSATIGSQNLTINSDAVIGRDLLGGSSNITLNGKVSRDITSGSQVLLINGSVGRDVNGYIDNINIGSTGNVSGSVNYTSKNDLSIASGGVIGGTAVRTEPKSDRIDIRPETMISIIVGSLIFVYIAAIVFALTLALLFPKVLENSVAGVMKSPGKAVLTGLVALIVMPVLIIALMVTVVGMPVAAFVLLAWLLILMISGPAAGYLLGKLILRKSKQPVLIMLVGASILLVAMAIPFIGLIAFWGASMFGTGAILMQSTKLFARK